MENVGMSCESTRSCHFFVDRKNRSCKMTPVPGSVFCWQHVPLDSVNHLATRVRISCPLDSKHNCFEDELESHLKRCNSRKKPQPNYYEENINSGKESDQPFPKTLLQHISNDKLLDVLKKVGLIYRDIPSLTNRISSSQVLEKELGDESNGCEAMKHLKQNASLIGILEQNDLLKDGNVFIEFGAGRGQLSHWIVKTQNPSGKSAFLLVDKASQRHKLDNRIKVGLEIQRIKIDIEHLNLGRVPLVQNHENVIITSKHLCGAATDLALRCISSYLDEDSQENQKVKGVLIATCCHHRCSWQSFMGKKYLKDYGIGEEEFYILQKISSWATCGNKAKLKTSTEESPASSSSSTIPGYRYDSLDLAHDQRELIGFQSKIIIDYARILYLNERGFSSELISYTSKDISPENVAILATLVKK